MLTNLKIRSIEPDGIMAMIAQINGEDLSKGDFFEQYTTGVYRHDGYKFNFNQFIENNTNNNIMNEWAGYGVCDNYQQVLNYYKDLFNNSDKKQVIVLCTVRRNDQESSGGWRWHKWGRYIGNQNPQHEYLYDDTHIDLVYCYHIYEID
jgi:hypothetical protein